MERGISRCFLSYCRKCGFPRVATAPEGASHVVSGKSGILSSDEGPLGIPLKLVQVNRASSRVEAGNSALTGISGSLWRFPWGVRRRLVLEHGTLLPSRGEAGNSGFLSSSERYLGVPMEISLGSQTSSRVGAWNSASLSRWQRGVRPPVVLR